MTTSNTNEEWLAIINRAEMALPTTLPKYTAPGLGTTQFAKCIDHTSLKLDVKKSQIEDLCEEAKKHDFKVSGLSAGIV